MKIKDQNKVEWRVCNVLNKTDREAEAIAHNLGMNKSTFIRSKMTEVIQAMPDHLKKINFRD